MKRSPSNARFDSLGPRLYLDRLWRDEGFVAAELIARSKPAARVNTDVLAAGLKRLFTDEPDDLQRLAAATCSLQLTAVLGGGPGTGKTTTVTRILILLDDKRPPPARRHRSSLCSSNRERPSWRVQRR